MEDEEELAVQLPHDAFPDAHQGHDLAAHRRRDRRVDPAQQRGTDDADALEGLAPHPWGPRLEGDRDVGGVPHFRMLSTEKTGALPPPPPTAPSPPLPAPFSSP